MEAVEPAPVLRLVSCLTSHEEMLPALEEELIELFGPIALRSQAFDFELSDYYETEMGGDLKRYWYGFEELVGAECLADFRWQTEEIEKRNLQKDGRMLNLDPGYLDYGKLVLASLKEGADKIYMGRCVWAHTCLRYRHGDFTAPDHSFADFKDGRFNDFMKEARVLYRQLLRQHKKSE